MDTILGYKASRVESITDKSFILQKKKKATYNSDGRQPEVDYFPFFGRN